MTYKLKFSDFEYYRPRADEIRQSDILPLMFHVLPGSKYSGTIVNYTNDESDLVLLIDEREDPTGFMFIGGILIARDDLEKVKRFMIKFKKKFKPNLKPSGWFLKGSGTHEGETKDSLDHALTRWLLWSKHLGACNFHYQFHSCSLNKNKYHPSSTNKKYRNIEFYKVLYEGLFDSLEQHKFSKIEIVTDNIEGAQLTAFNDVVSSYQTTKIKLLTAKAPIRKGDLSSFESFTLQFVDMQIYAMSRFIYPSGSNVLMDFEKFSYAHSSGKIFEINDDHAVNIMAAKYYIISDMYHHIRNKIKTNICSPNFNEPISTMALISDKIHRNFGSSIDGAIFDFCHGPKKDVTFDISVM